MTQTDDARGPETCPLCESVHIVEQSHAEAYMVCKGCGCEGHGSLWALTRADLAPIPQDARVMVLVDALEKAEIMLRQRGLNAMANEARAALAVFYLTPKGARAALEAGESLCPDDFPPEDAATDRGAGE